MSRVDSSLSARHVLIIDDDRGLQTLFLTLLERNGFFVDVAHNGAQAYDLIRRNAYSVVLLDLMMPEVNGFELIARLERDSPWLLSRIIVVSGASRSVIEQFDARKVWGLLRKPFDLNELIAAIHACSGGRAQQNAPVTRPAFLER
jgi:DNA-binding response OmpR family regulator